MGEEKKKRVMVVDDDPSLVKVMRIYLERSGFEVHVATDGQMALELLDRVRPHLMVLDIRLPKIDGLKVCRLIRVDRGNKRLPIIVLTAHHSQERKRQIMAAGANLYLTKPLDMSKLVKHTKELISASEGPK